MCASRSLARLNGIVFSHPRASAIFRLLPTLLVTATVTAFDALALAQLVRTREASPRELVDAAIGRIERLNPQLNAVVHFMFAQARRRTGLMGSWLARSDSPPRSAALSGAHVATGFAGLAMLHGVHSCTLRCVAFKGSPFKKFQGVRISRGQSR